MRRRLFTIGVFSIVAACADRSAESIDSAGPAAESSAVPVEPITSFDSAIVALQGAVAPLDSAFDAMPAALSPDSGSTRADSILLALQTQLDARTHAVVRIFNDSAFQILVWPEGARGSQLRRARERSGEPTLAADALEADSIRRFLLSHGIWSYPAEGDMYFVLSLDRLMSTASPYVTQAAREALRIERLEQISPTGSDASIQIPWDSLGDRLAATDRFIATFENAPARPLIEDRRVWYLRGFLTGWDNTDVFDPRSRILKPEVHRAYERFLQVHDATASAAIVQAYVDLLANTQHRRTREVDEFLRNRSGIPRD